MKMDERGDAGLGMILIMAVMMLGMMWGGHKMHQRHKRHDSPKAEQPSQKVRSSTAPVGGALEDIPQGHQTQER